jgi:hypothetical protein
MFRTSGTISVSSWARLMHEQLVMMLPRNGLGTTFVAGTVYTIQHDLTCLPPRSIQAPT